MTIREMARSILYSKSRNILLKEGFWVAFGQLVSAVGLLVGIRLLTLYVPPDVFGSINLLLGMTTLGYSLLCLPVLQAALRFFPEEAIKERLTPLKQTVVRILQRRTLLLTSLILIIGAFYAWSSRMSYWVFVALSGMLVVDIIRGMETVFLAAARQHRLYSLWSIADAWLKSLSIFVVFVFIGINLRNVLFGYLGVSFIMLFLVYSTSNDARRTMTINACEQDMTLERDIQSYVMPLIPLALVGWVSGLGDRYILGSISGLEKVGVYSAVYGLISRPFLMVGAIIEQTLRPVYFESISSGNRKAGKKTLYVWATITAITCVIGLITVTLFRKEIGSLLLAERYQEGIPLMPWIALGYSFLALSFVFEKPAYAVKKTRAVLFIQIAGACASVCIGLPLIYFWGLSGAAIAVPLYFGVQLLISILIALRIMRRE